MSNQVVVQVLRDGWKGSGMSGRTLRGAVLITGCSSGIGRAAAISLREAGLPVYATARRVETLEDLAGRGIHTLPLDVTTRRP